MSELSESDMPVQTLHALPHVQDEHAAHLGKNDAVLTYEVRPLATLF